MHRAIAARLLAKPWLAFALTAIFSVLSPQGMSPFTLAAGAIPVLLLLGRDAKLGVQALIAGGFAIEAIMLGNGYSPVWGTVCVLLVLGAPFGLALLLQKWGSLRWCFQVAVLTATLLLAAIYALMDDAVGQWRALLHETVRRLAEAKLIADEKTILASLEHTNWGSYVTLALLSILGALFLGCWWRSLVQSPGAFGKEFQQLRLGKALSTFALGMLVSAFAFDRFGISAPWVDAMVWIWTVALAFQGLAAAHRLKATGRLGSGWLAAAYVLLLTLTPVMLMLLAGWGVADNWRRTV